VFANEENFDPLEKFISDSKDKRHATLSEIDPKGVERKLGKFKIVDNKEMSHIFEQLSKFML